MTSRPGIYVLSHLLLDFSVLGLPVPQGAVRHFGRGRPSAYGNQDTLLPWREQVQHGAEAAIQGREYYRSPTGDFPLSGPVALAADFTMRKPSTAPKTKVTYPIARPDLSKLLRAVEDALVAAGVIRDDAQLVEERVCKVYPDEEERSLHIPGVHLRVYGVVLYQDGVVKDGS